MGTLTPPDTKQASHDSLSTTPHKVTRPAAISVIFSVIIAVVALLIAIATLQFAGSSAWQSKVSLTVSGRTNGPDGERLVMFTLSNKSRVAINHGPLCTIQGPDGIPFAERLIGSIRRECLNHVLVLGERHLRRTLARYFAYYHRARTHLSLDKDAPHGRRIERPELGRVIPIREVGGLHHRYVRRAA